MLNLTEADKDFLDLLPALPDQALDKVRAHIAAGGQMTFEIGWTDNDHEAECGCLVGVGMTEKQYRRNNTNQLWILMSDGLSDWLMSRRTDRTTSWSPEVLDALALLLDIEYRRRNPIKNKVVEEVACLV